jgi:hypothetical protein
VFSHHVVYNYFVINDKREKKMTKTATSYETYAEYVAARRATRHDVLPETLWTALKENESLCNPRMAEGFAEFEAAWRTV